MTTSIPLAFEADQGSHSFGGDGGDPRSLHGLEAPIAPRVALYSHDTVGLGHFRRNLLIARTLSRTAPRPTSLMIAGATEAGHFERPAGVDLLTLPSLGKQAAGQYKSRALDIDLAHILRIRSQSILAALDAFEPDVFIVDNVPRGACGELDAALAFLRQQGHTRVVLGLRDLIDEPGTVAREWNALRNVSALRDFYDAIWVYGDPNVFDLVKEYRFPEAVAKKTRYVGYFDRRSERDLFVSGGTGAPVPTEPYALCMVGGGEDGGALAEAFSQVAFTESRAGVILTGPFMPTDTVARIRRRAAGNRHLSVHGFTRDTSSLLAHADRVVTMGGYNAISEVLSFDTPALVVPRTTPRREQWLRARRLRELGLLDMCEPEQLSPDILGAWLDEPKPPTPSTRDCVDLHGLSRLPSALSDLVGARGQEASTA